MPITNRLGSLEWVDSTEPLKSIINREHMRVNKNRDLNHSASLNAIREWLRKLPGNHDFKESIVHQHLTLMELDSDHVIDAFNKHTQMM